MPKKDAVTCEKLRVVGSKRRSGDLRMGQPDQDQPWSPAPEFIGGGRAPRELKHLSTSRKRKDSLSSGERNGNSSNATRVIAGRRCVARVVRRDSRAAARRRSEKSAR